MKEKLIKICNLTIEISFYFLFLLVPLILTPYNYELFEFNKMLLTYGLTVIIVGAWLIKMIAGRELKIQRTPLDLPILFFLISQVLSTIFSIDRHTSIWGYYSRFHGGLLSSISYILLYYALVSNLCDRKKIFNLLSVSLFSGSLVAIYGILEHFGHSFSCLLFGNNFDVSCWIQDVQNRVFATLGQPNWLAAYLNILLFIILGLIFQATNFRYQAIPPSRWNTFALETFKGKLKIFIFYFLFFIFYLCLLYTKSRSGFLAFIFCLFIFSAFLIIRGIINKSLKFYVFILTTLYLILATTTFFVQPPFFHLDKIGYSRFKSIINSIIQNPSPAIPLTKPAEGGQSGASSAKPVGPALEAGGTESGVIRKIVWRGALDIALHYPLFGSGVETFAYSYYQFRPASHNLVSEWDFLYNKAHNEFLNYAATTGFFGLTAYLSVIGFFVFWVLKNLKCQISNVKSKSKNLKLEREKILDSSFGFESCVLSFAFLAAYLSILITNFFGFSVVIVAIYFWLIPAFCFILANSLTSNKVIYLKFYKDEGGVEKSHGQKGREKNGGKDRTYLANDTSIRPLSNLQIFFIIFILFSIFYFLFSIYKYWLADTKYALGQNYDKANAFTTSYPLLKQAISLNPREPVYYDQLSYCTSNLAYLAFSQKQNQLATQLINEALTATQKATKISPYNLNFWKTKTKVFYVLSSINEKYNYEALQALQRAKELAPTDAKIYYNLALLYNRVNQKDKAIETLKEAINLKNNYRDAYYALGLFLAEKGEKKEAIKVFEDILVKFATDDPKIKEKIEEWRK